MTRMRHPRQFDGKHLEFLRQLPCVICLDNTATEAAHIRFADRSVAKPMTGMGRKPDDAFALPLCGKHHREQHTMNERAWWQSQGIDPVKTALALWYWRGDVDACCVVVANARQM